MSRFLLWMRRKTRSLPTCVPYLLLPPLLPLLLFSLTQCTVKYIGDPDCTNTLPFESKIRAMSERGFANWTITFEILEPNSKTSIINAYKPIADSVFFVPSRVKMQNQDGQLILKEHMDGINTYTINDLGTIEFHPFEQDKDFIESDGITRKSFYIYFDDTDIDTVMVDINYHLEDRCEYVKVYPDSMKVFYNEKLYYNRTIFPDLLLFTKTH